MEKIAARSSQQSKNFDSESPICKQKLAAQTARIAKFPIMSLNPYIGLSRGKVWCFLSVSASPTKFRWASVAASDTILDTWRFMTSGTCLRYVLSISIGPLRSASKSGGSDPADIDALAVPIATGCNVRCSLSRPGAHMWDWKGAV